MVWYGRPYIGKHGSVRHDPHFFCVVSRITCHTQPKWRHPIKRCGERARSPSSHAIGSDWTEGRRGRDPICCVNHTLNFNGLFIGERVAVAAAMADNNSHATSPNLTHRQTRIPSPPLLLPKFIPGFRLRNDVPCILYEANALFSVPFQVYAAR